MKDCLSKFVSFIVAASIITLQLMTLVSTGFGLDPQKKITQYTHDVWTSETGLPASSVYAIKQTRDGYLWLGTEEGLLRFDGVKFTVFDKNNTEAIKDNIIRTLYEGRDGSLWIGFNGGGVVQLKNGKFTAYTVKEGLSGNYVRAICEDREGSLWISTRDNGLNRLKDGKFTVFTTNNGLPSNNISDMYEDREGNIWMNTDNGLTRLKDGGFTSFTEKDGLSGDLRGICEDREGSLWIGTVNAGLYRFRDGKFTRFTTKDGLPSDSVRTIREDRDGNLWIGTKGGVVRLKDDRLNIFTANDGLTNDSVCSIYEDREGSLWIGTQGGGLDRIKDGKFTPITTREGLSYDDVWTIYEDGQGALWIGTKKGLNRFQDGKFTIFTTKDGLSDNEVWAINGDREGSLWIGTWNGLNRFKDGKFTIFTTKDGLSSNQIRVIHEDRKGSIWIGTSGGLDCFNGGKFTSFTTKEGRLGNGVRAIYEDREGNMWIGTYSAGLYRFREGKFTLVGTKEGLSDIRVRAIYEDREGTLWVGTRGGGLGRLKEGIFTVVTSREGLFNDTVWQIIEDDNNNLWMSCNKGIFRVSKKEIDYFVQGKARSIKSIPYGIADGMRSNQCNGGSHYAGIRTKDGRLWFPTAKGVVVINPNHIKTNTLLPPVIIEQVFIDRKPIDARQKLDVSPGAGELEIHYTALSLLFPERMKFKYKLEGFDKDWIDAGARRVAYYTNIPPGNYRFRVLASNNDGVWNEAGAFCDFHLAPYFYQTYWFYSFCGLLTAGIVWSLHRLRLKMVSNLHRQRLEQIEARFFAIQTERNRIAREMHDTLLQGIVGASALLGAVNKIIITSPQQAGEYLELARGQLKESLDDIRMAISNLRHRTGDKKNLSDFINESIQRLTKDTSINARCEVFGELQPIPSYVTENLLRIGCEAVGNAIRHAAPGNILVELQFEPESIELRICDDGIGFEVDAPIDDDRPHFGLIGMRERVAAMEGEFTLESQPGAGTKISVRVPIQRSWMQAAA